MVKHPNTNWPLVVHERNGGAAFLLRDPDGDSRKVASARALGTA